MEIEFDSDGTPNLVLIGRKDVNTRDKHNAASKSGQRSSDLVTDGDAEEQGIYLDDLGY